MQVQHDAVPEVDIVAAMIHASCGDTTEGLVNSLDSDDDVEDGHGDDFQQHRHGNGEQHFSC